MKLLSMPKFSRASTHARAKGHKGHKGHGGRDNYDSYDDYDDYDEGFGSSRGGSRQRRQSSYDSFDRDSFDRDSYGGDSYGGDSRDDGYMGRDRTSRMSGGRRSSYGSYGSSGGSGNVQEQLKDLINDPATRNRCGECQATFPTWCSVNLGVFLCGRCASVHRKLLTGRSDAVHSSLKSVSLDRWTGRDIAEVQRLGGNRGNEETWNPRKEPFPFDADDDKTQAERYIREKYILGKYRFSEVLPEDFGPESRPGSRSGSRSGFRSTMHSEEYDYGRHSSNGSRRERERAASVSSRRDVAPATASDLAMPSRRATISSRPAATPAPTPAAPAPLPAPAPGPSAAAIQAQATGLVQQYYDPNTGVVYMDQQQYASTLQQQQAMQQQALQQQALQQQALQQQALQQQALQQQALQQQALQQQAQQQANKNAIMGLYARPDMYTTPVEITPTNPLYPQMTAQMAQQQQQQQQQAQQYPQQYPQQFR